MNGFKSNKNLLCSRLSFGFMLLLVLAMTPLAVRGEAVSASAHSKVSITKLPHLSVSQVRNDELLFDASRRSNQSYLKVNSGGQAMPYRLAAAYRLSSDSAEVPIAGKSGRHAYSIFWTDRQGAGVSLHEIVESDSVMMSNAVNSDQDSILQMELNDAGIVKPVSGDEVQTLVLTFVIE